MKNLLIYTGPSKKLTVEDEVLIKIQIDNSLDLGWKREDIILAFDFPFEYNGVKSLVLPDGLYYNFDLLANKIPVLIYLISNRIISDNYLYWCHDLDAFELNKIEESELGLQNYDLGLTHYTYKPEWQFGSLFFKVTAFDMFEQIHKETLRKPHLSRNNEKVLTKLIKDNQIDPRRYKRLNVSYNIMKKYLQTIYPLAIKPLRVLHFRPSDAKDIMIDGNNSLKLPLINERLRKIFQKYDIK